MRLLFESLVALALVGILAGVMRFNQTGKDEERDADLLRDHIRLIEQQVTLQAVLERVPINEFGYPETIDPEWFGNSVPRHTLLDGPQPWLEVAAPSEWNNDHPDERIVITTDTAGFWYNPRKGVVRARVPQMISDQKTLELYNAVNSSGLKSIFAREL